MALLTDKEVYMDGQLLLSLKTDLKMFSNGDRRSIYVDMQQHTRLQDLSAAFSMPSRGKEIKGRVLNDR